MLRCIRCGACMNHCPVYLATGGHAYGWVYPGPMGSVLTPQFIGIEQGWPLPNASTFCGRCEEVCPVRIPLPKLMRHWREEQFRRGLAPPTARCGLGVLGLRRPPAAALPPGRRAGARAACGCSAAAGGCAGRRWPAAGPRTRDLPAPQGGTFMSQWRAEGAGGERARRDPGARAPRARRARPRSRPRPKPRSRAGSRPMPATWCPARGQLEREERVQLFAELAMAVTTDVQRLATLAEVPAAVSAYLRRAQPAAEARRWRPSRCSTAPTGTASRCCGCAAATPSTPTRSGSRWRSPALPRPARWSWPPRPSGRPCWPTCPRPASSWSPPTGSRPPTRRPGNRCGPCPAACRVRSTSSPARRAPPTSPSSSSWARTAPSGS